jgi:hypothetical protein
MLKQSVIAIAVVLLTATVAAASVRAVVDRNQAAVGESIDLQVIIDGGGGGDVDLSGIRDFRIASRGSSSNFQMINGRTSRQHIYDYRLIPLKTGSLTIPAIPVTVDGKVSYTSPIRIMVSKAPPVASGRGDVYVTAAVSDASPWVGQQITYTFRLYNAVQVSDAKFQAPDFNGFNAQELKDRHSHRTVINGRAFIVTEVVYILVPDKAGPLTIKPATLQVGLVQQNSQPWPFSGMGAFFGQPATTTRMLATKPVTVNVRPLPPSPPGTSFSGLVGRFKMSANLEKKNLQVGDSATMTITVSGSGNIMDATAPAIPAPKGFKTYADSPEVKVKKDVDGYTGSKVFRTALVPVKAGRYHIDPIVLTYFDVSSGNYRNISTAAMEINVSPSKMAPTNIEVFRGTPPAPTAVSKTQVKFTGRDILPLKEGLDALNSQRSLPPLWFGLLLVVPVLGFAVAKTVGQIMAREDPPGRIMADRAKDALKKAGVDGSSDADFLSSLYRALVSAILSRQGLIATSLTWSEAKARLVAIGWDENDAAAIAGLLEEIESFNYSGGSLNREKRTDLLDRTRQAVRRLV